MNHKIGTAAEAGSRCSIAVVMVLFNRPMMRNVLSIACSVVLVSLSGTFAQNPNPTPTPVPKVTGPIPVTADSHPFMANLYTLGAQDLTKLGYVEEEFIVSGNANVYDWMKDGSLKVLSSNGAYATRILVRRPATAARFSGSVFVEILNNARRYDWAMLWGYMHDALVERGDAWIGVTMPGGIAGLQKFNPKRYAALSFANPTPNAPCPGGAANSISPTEEGMRFDMLSQVGALLKSDVPTRPLATLRVESVYMTTQNVDMVTYMNAIQPQAKLSNGKPVYDGFLMKSPLAPAKINRCATAPAKDDPRSIIRNVGVPVIAIASQGEVLNTSAFRRPDSDERTDRFRLYEVAGASHIDKSPYFGLPAFSDQALTGGNVQGTADWPFAAKCDPDIPLTELPLMSYVFAAAVGNLDQWVRKGIAPPNAKVVEIKNAGAADASILLDQYGHGLGGIRSPYVDVPVATYFTNSNGPGTCPELGHKAAFDAARFNSLYPTSANYVSKVSQSVDEMVRQRWLTESDAKKIKAEASTYRPPSGR
jgi:hypothetical protein